jgi:sec-independent protein translocase protein TatC
VIVALLAAIITPTPDFLTFSYVFVPLVLLYVLGIGMSMLVQPRRPKAAV